MLICFIDPIRLTIDFKILLWWCLHTIYINLVITFLYNILFDFFLKLR